MKILGVLLLVAYVPVVVITLWLLYSLELIFLLSAYESGEAWLGIVIGLVFVLLIVVWFVANLILYIKRSYKASIIFSVVGLIVLIVFSLLAYKFPDYLLELI